MANGTDDFQKEPRVVSEKVARVSLVQLTVVGLALFCLLVAWKEANSVGEQLRSSIIASELLVEKEAQCVFSLGALLEKAKHSEEELGVLKQVTTGLSRAKV